MGHPLSASLNRAPKHSTPKAISLAATLLARLVARNRPDDKEAQATAGIYTELIGDTKTADDYHEAAGTEIKERLDEMFE